MSSQDLNSNPVNKSTAATQGFTCDVVDGVEADSKPPDFVWVFELAASSRLLNSFPVFVSKRSIVVGVQSRTFAKQHVEMSD